MDVLVSSVIFFSVFAGLWYLLQAKNVWGLGSKAGRGRQALFQALFTAAVATAVFAALNLAFA